MPPMMGSLLEYEHNAKKRGSHPLTVFSVPKTARCRCWKDARKMLRRRGLGVIPIVLGRARKMLG